MNQLALHILDVAQNSIRANAKLVNIAITENPQSDEYQIEIADDGEGMTTEQLKRAADPFFTSRTTRKVGLGLPLIKQNAELSGGRFFLDSEKGKGTKVSATFGWGHIDRPVLGDIAGTLLILAGNEKQTDFLYTHQTPNGVFRFDTREVKESLEDVPISAPEVRSFLIEMIRENLEQIQISE